MTKKEMRSIKAEVKFFHREIKWKEGYCCYQDDNIGTSNMIEIGNNHGIYGWNWTLYFSTETMTFYLSGYRNM